MSRADKDSINRFSDELNGRYSMIEMEFWSQLARRLKTSRTKDIHEWYINQLRKPKRLSSEFYEEVARNKPFSEKIIDQAIKDTAQRSQKDIDDHLRQAFTINDSMDDLDEIMKAYKNQVFVNLDNYVNQTLLSTVFGEGSLTKLYENIVNDVMAEFGKGKLTLQQATEKTILEWADKGIPSAFIDKGGNAWSLERYVDTVMRSTLNRLYNEVRTARMSEYGITTVIMTEVIDAAPRCAYCQGKVLDMRQPKMNDSGYPSIYEYGYGTAGGTLGINCRHAIFPFIPGVNFDNGQQNDPEEAIEKSKVRARQRELERRIRKTKKKIIVAKELNSPDLIKYKKLLRKQQSDIREFLKEPDWLRRNYGREKVITPKEILMKGSL